MFVFTVRLAYIFFSPPSNKCVFSVLETIRNNCIGIAGWHIVSNSKLIIFHCKCSSDQNCFLYSSYESKKCNPN